MKPASKVFICCLRLVEHEFYSSDEDEYGYDDDAEGENGNGNGPPTNTKLTPALRKALQVGSVCNNARENEAGVFVGQSTDVALINVLRIFDLSDPRPVRKAIPRSL